MAAVRRETVRVRDYCLDTGPLLDLLLLRFIEDDGPRLDATNQANLLEKVQFLRNIPLREAFERFVEAVQLHTTPGVIVEMDAHVLRATHKRSPVLERFRSYVAKEIQSLQIEEEVMPVGEFCDLEHRKFGPVDASLLALARKHRNRKLTIITGDGPLHGWCLKHTVRCKGVHEVQTWMTPQW